MRTLFQTIKQQFLEGNDLVLVSVTASSGSTPRGAGSRMLVGKNGRISGTIGGGAVEYRAECMALDILEKKESCEHGGITFLLTGFLFYLFVTLFLLSAAFFTKKFPQKQQLQA